MSMRRSASPELSEAARVRLDALRRDLLREAGPAPQHEVGPGSGTGRGAEPEAPPTRQAPAPPPPATQAPPAAAMPVPGRHATRRARPTPGWVEAVADRLPAGLGERPLGPAHVAVVAVLAAVVIAGGAWWALQVQSDVAPAAAPVAGGSSASAPARALVDLPDGPTTPAGARGVAEEGADPGSRPTGAARAGTNPLSVVVVDVAGKVRRPGLATLPEGARVADAIEAAGGPRRGVRLTSLNLARVLVDGEQVLVGVRAVTGAAPVAGEAPGSAGGTVLVNLNSADATTLETLPGVGPVTAAAIVAWREERGGFRSVTELVEVSGIGPATLEELTPHVTV